MTGDWGGGYAIGLAGLGAAVRAGDGRGPATSLRALVSGHFGFATPELLALALADDQLPMAALHELPLSCSQRQSTVIRSPSGLPCDSPTRW